MLISKKPIDKILDAFCGRPWQHIKINCEGDLSMCCWQKYGTLGNVLNDNFMDLWKSDLAKDIRKTTYEHKLHPECLKGFCPYKHSNLNETHQVIYSKYPSSCELDLPNTHCNVGFEKPSIKTPACIMCPRSSKNFRPETDLLKQVCERIYFLLNYLKNIHIQGIAEPFYKNKIFDVLDWLKYDSNPNLEVSTITNGTLFSAYRRQKFNEICPKQNVCFSMDAGTRETYKKIRILDAYNVVKKNLIAYGKNKGNNILWINNNINILNVNECDKMVEDAYEAEANYIQFTTTDKIIDNVNIEGKIIEDITVNKSNYRLFEKAQEIIIKRSSQLGVRVVFLKPLHHNLIQISK